MIATSVHPRSTPTALRRVVRTLPALFVVILAAGCASPGAVGPASPSSPGGADAHAVHAPAAPGAGAPAAGSVVDPRLQAMQEMQRKMVNTTTPEQRQALMADHMMAMQDGMTMMKDMSRMQGMQGMGGGMGGPGADAPGPGPASGSGTAEVQGMPPGMAWHQRMMAERMEAMQLMMDMLRASMPPAAR